MKVSVIRVIFSCFLCKKLLSLVVLCILPFGPILILEVIRGKLNLVSFSGSLVTLALQKYALSLLVA